MSSKFRENDIIILVLGQTGAGKSTFINTAAGKPLAIVGDDLCPQTRKPQHFIVNHNGHRTVFVECPGFDDPYRSDRQIVDHIVEWLEKSRQSGLRAARIALVFLLEITQTHHNPSRDGMTPKKLWDPNFTRNMILATTKWSLVAKDDGKRRAQDLTRIYGSSTMPIAPFTDTYKSAWSIVDQVFPRESIDVLQFQQNLSQILPNPTPVQRTRRSIWRRFLALFR